MSHFNATTKGSMRTTNRSGHAAYRMAVKLDLTIKVETSFLQGSNRYYGNTDNVLIKLTHEVCENEPDYVCRLAAYARNVMNMRSVSHLLCAIIAHDVKGSELVRKAIASCIVRGDDATEILSAYLALFGKPIPNSLRRGVADGIANLSAYSIAKYQGNSKALKMRDAIRITHPKPTSDEIEAALAACAAGTLKSPVTWESELSANGNNAEVWHKLVSDDRVPYMALLRNLRNIESHADDETLDVALARIANPERVAKSRQLPFRFFSAYREVERTKTRRSIAEAIDSSIVNFPRLDGRTLVIVDESGSMVQPVSPKSKVTCFDVARVLAAAIVCSADDAEVLMFSSASKSTGIRTIRTTPKAGILANVDLMGGTSWGGTDMALPFKHIIETKRDFDRIIVLSDNEVNYGTETIQCCADEFRRQVGHDVWVHAIDIAGYGSQQFIGKDTNIIGGWNDQVITFIAKAEGGLNSMVDEIAAYQL